MRRIGQQKRMKLLKSVGFYQMTKLRLTSMHTDFMVFIRDNFIQSEIKVKLGGGQYLILTEEDIERVYNLPRGRKRISLTSCEKEDVMNLKEKLNVEFNNKSKELVSVTDIHRRLQTYKDDETWTKAMILCCISYVLCSKSNQLINLKYAACMKNLDEINEFNWCRHILEHCQQNIKPTDLYQSADFNFMTLHVMDTLHNETTIDEAPTCRKWGTDDVKKAFDKIKDDFANAIADKLLKAQQDRSNDNSEEEKEDEPKADKSVKSAAEEEKEDEPKADKSVKSAAESIFNVGLSNINKMPSAESCINVEQCNQLIMYSQYNIKAWNNYIQELKDKIKELTGTKENEKQQVPEKPRKRKHL